MSTNSAFYLDYKLNKLAQAHGDFKEQCDALIVGLYGVIRSDIQARGQWGTK